MIAVTEATTIVLPVGAANPVVFDNTDLREIVFVYDTLSGSTQVHKPDDGFILSSFAEDEVLH